MTLSRCRNNRPSACSLGWVGRASRQPCTGLSHSVGRGRPRRGHSGALPTCDLSFTPGERLRGQLHSCGLAFAHSCSPACSSQNLPLERPRQQRVPGRGSLPHFPGATELAASSHGRARPSPGQGRALLLFPSSTKLKGEGWSRGARRLIRRGNRRVEAEGKMQGGKFVFFSQLLCARHCIRSSTYLTLFDLHNNPMDQILFIITPRPSGLGTHASSVVTQGPGLRRSPALSLMLCWQHLEILHNFLARGSVLPCCTGPCKFGTSPDYTQFTNEQTKAHT